MCVRIRWQLTIHKWTKNITAYHNAGWQVAALSDQEGSRYYQTPKNDEQVAPSSLLGWHLLKA